MPTYELTCRIVFKAKSLRAAFDEGFEILRAPYISEGSVSTTGQGVFIRAIPKPGKNPVKTDR